MSLVLDRTLINKPRQKHWVSYILKRISQNKNFLGFISGPTGSGKSWSSLSIAESLDPNFSIKRVVFSGIELMTLINSGSLERGSVIVFEESGVEMSNRNWQSVTNKMLNYLLQTFRHRNFILIFNSPHMDFVDAATRKLFHAEIQTMSIDHKRNICKLKPQLIQYNGRMQKFYYKRLRVITGEGIQKIDIWNVHKPSDELIKDYEDKKRAFTDALNQKIVNELLQAQQKQQAKQNKNPGALTEIQADVVKLLKEGMTLDQIVIARHRAKRSIQNCMALIKKKGYKFHPIYYRGSKKIKRYKVYEPDNE